MSGWYAMHRGWQNHPVFGECEFSERDAWIWLIENVVHSDTRVNIAGEPIMLRRGQLSYSIRYLADAWQWHRNKVARFLDRLSNWEAIKTDSGTGQIIITICNYAKYQDIRDSGGTEPGRVRDSAGTNNNNDNNEEQRKGKNPSPKPPPVLLPEWMPLEVWSAYVDHRKAMKMGCTDYALKLAMKKIDKFRQSGHDPTAIVNQTIENGWKGLFEIKGDIDGNRNATHHTKPNSPHANFLAGFGLTDLE